MFFAIFIFMIKHIYSMQKYSNTEMKILLYNILSEILFKILIFYLNYSSFKDLFLAFLPLLW